jgi:hypothetical protein
MKALGEIERDKFRVVRSYNKTVKENCFKSEILFGRQFCLSSPKATSLGNNHQIGKDRIKLGSSSWKFLYGSGNGHQKILS